MQAFRPSIQHLWKLETFRLKSISIAKEQSNIVNTFKKSIEKEDDRYPPRWPWKVENQSIPENYELRIPILKGLVKSFERKS